jgi:hypothetical protein
MRRSGFAKRAAALVVLVVTGFLLGTYLDRRFTSDEADYQVASIAGHQPSACIGEDGTRKHWHRANVPMLSPKCTGKRRASVPIVRTEARRFHL